jgi:hypothetical protein
MHGILLGSDYIHHCVQLGCVYLHIVTDIGGTTEIQLTSVQLSLASRVVHKRGLFSPQLHVFV